MHHLTFIKLWQRFVHHVHEIVVAIVVECGRMHTIEILLLGAAILAALALQVYVMPGE